MGRNQFCLTRCLNVGCLGIEGHGYHRLGRDFRSFPEDGQLTALHRAGPPLRKPAAEVARVDPPKHG